MSFKCAFLGCGPRAQGHAAAYTLIKRGAKVACCDMNQQRLDDFAAKHGIPQRYTDLDRMLATERPDVVHVVTPPTLRVGLMTCLAEAGVPGVIVEKPICIGAEDYLALRALAARSRTKFVVNHQLRHHPCIVEFLADVQAGKLGQVRCLDASAVFPLSGQGVHVLDLMFAFAGYPGVQTIFAACSGYDDINGTHPSPRTTAALLTFRNGMRGALQSGAGAPMFDPKAPTWAHKRIAIYGTHGFRHWWMHGWEKGLRNGTVKQGVHQYGDQDILGQAGLTNAMFDWLEDDRKPSPTNLTTALDEWLVILGAYLSAIEKRPVDLPFDPPADLLARYQRYAGVAAK